MLKIDKENEKFSLGIKQLEPNPWEDILKKYTVGSEVTGPVTSVTDFGVFVSSRTESMAWSTALSWRRTGSRPLRSTSVRARRSPHWSSRSTPIEQKISLSIRAVNDRAERAALKEIAEQQSATQTTTLGDLLAEKLAKGQGD